MTLANLVVGSLIWLLMGLLGVWLGAKLLFHRVTKVVARNRLSGEASCPLCLAGGVEGEAPPPPPGPEGGAS